MIEEIREGEIRVVVVGVLRDCPKERVCVEQNNHKANIV